MYALALSSGVIYSVKQRAGFEPSESSWSFLETAYGNIWPGQTDREMQATQTQQGLPSVLEARGLFFVSSDGLGFFGFAFGFWFGFFRLDLNIWNFSFHFPP